MDQTTGQSYRSKSRPAEFFVNKCYWCYWQYQFMLGLEKRERVEGKKSRAGERRTVEYNMHQYVLVAKDRHYQNALCAGVHM